MRRYPRKNNSSGAITSGRIVFLLTHTHARELTPPFPTPHPHKKVCRFSFSLSLKNPLGGRGAGIGETNFFFGSPHLRYVSWRASSALEAITLMNTEVCPQNSENGGTHAHRTSVCQKGKCCFFSLVLWHLNNHERPTHMHFKEKLHQRA